MIRENVRSLLRALPDVREDGTALTFDQGWEITVHAGRAGAPLSVQQVVKATLEADFVVFETQKGQRYVIFYEEIRAAAADPSSAEKKARRPGFM